MLVFFASQRKLKNLSRESVGINGKTFPWYYDATYYTGQETLTASIIEPFVCIHCKERKNVTLKNFSGIMSYEEAREFINGWKEQYEDHMMDEALVNDMIADMQLVDREYLALAEAITNPPKTDLETEMEQLVRTVKAGHLPELDLDNKKALKNMEKDFAVQAATS